MHYNEQVNQLPEQIKLAADPCYKIDKLGRPNYGWKKINENRAKQKWAKFDLLLTKDQHKRLKRYKNMSEKIRTYIEWGLEEDAALNPQKR